MFSFYNDLPELRGGWMCKPGKVTPTAKSAIFHKMALKHNPSILDDPEKVKKDLLVAYHKMPADQRAYYDKYTIPENGDRRVIWRRFVKEPYRGPPKKKKSRKKKEPVLPFMMGNVASQPALPAGRPLPTLAPAPSRPVVRPAPVPLPPAPAPQPVPAPAPQPVPAPAPVIRPAPQPAPQPSPQANMVAAMAIASSNPAPVASVRPRTVVTSIVLTVSVLNYDYVMADYDLLPDNPNPSNVVANGKILWAIKARFSGGNDLLSEMLRLIKNEPQKLQRFNDERDLAFWDEPNAPPVQELMSQEEAAEIFSLFSDWHDSSAPIALQLMCVSRYCNRIGYGTMLCIERDKNKYASIIAPQPGTSVPLQVNPVPQNYVPAVGLTIDQVNKKIEEAVGGYKKTIRELEDSKLRLSTDLGIQMQKTSAQEAQIAALGRQLDDQRAAEQGAIADAVQKERDALQRHFDAEKAQWDSRIQFQGRELEKSYEDKITKLEESERRLNEDLANMKKINDDLTAVKTDQEAKNLLLEEAVKRAQAEKTAAQADFDKQILELNKQHDGFVQQIDEQNRRDLEAIRAEREKLTDQLREVRLQHEQDEKSLREIQEKHSALSRSLEKANKDLAKLRKEKKQVEDAGTKSVEDVKEEIKAEVARRREKEKEIAVAQEQIRDLQSQINLIKAERDRKYADYESKQEAAKRSEESLTKRIDELTREHGVTIGDMEKAKEELKSDLEGKIHAIELERERRVAEIEQEKDDEIAELKAERRRDFAEQERKHKETTDTLNKTIEDLRREKGKLTSEYEGKRKQWLLDQQAKEREWRAETAQRKKDLDDLETFLIKRVEKRDAKLPVPLQAYHSLVDKVTTQLDRMKKKWVDDAVAKQHKEDQKIIDQISEREQILIKARDKLNREAITKDELISSTEKQLADVRDELEGVRRKHATELEEAERRIQEATGTADALRAAHQSEISSLEQQINDLRATKGTSETRIMELQNQIDKLNADGQLQVQKFEEERNLLISTHAEETENLKKQIEALTTQIEEVKANHVAAIASINDTVDLTQDNDDMEDSTETKVAVAFNIPAAVQDRMLGLAHSVPRSQAAAIALADSSSFLQFTMFNKRRKYYVNAFPNMIELMNNVDRMRQAHKKRSATLVSDLYRLLAAAMLFRSRIGAASYKRANKVIPSPEMADLQDEDDDKLSEREMDSFTAIYLKSWEDLIMSKLLGSFQEEYSKAYGDLYNAENPIPPEVQLNNMIPWAQDAARETSLIAVSPDIYAPFQIVESMLDLTRKHLKETEMFPDDENNTHDIYSMLRRLAIYSCYSFDNKTPKISTITDVYTKLLQFTVRDIVGTPKQASKIITEINLTKDIKTAAQEEYENFVKTSMLFSKAVDLAKEGFTDSRLFQMKQTDAEAAVSLQAINAFKGQIYDHLACETMANTVLVGYVIADNLPNFDEAFGKQNIIQIRDGYTGMRQEVLDPRVRGNIEDFYDFAKSPDLYDRELMSINMLASWFYERPINMNLKTYVEIPDVIMQKIIASMVKMPEYVGSIVSRKVSRTFADKDQLDSEVMNSEKVANELEVLNVSQFLGKVTDENKAKLLQILNTPIQQALEITNIMTNVLAILKLNRRSTAVQEFKATL